MSVIATALKHMMAAGVSGEDLLRAVADMEEAIRAEPKPRSKGALRTERYRNRVKASQTSQNVTCDASDADPSPPNDIYSNPPVSPDVAKATCPPLSERVVSAWNDQAKRNGATGANSLDANRRKWLSLRVKDHGEDAVFTAIANIAASPFHCGKNDRGWSANIGWLLKSPENFLKALEMGGGRSGGAPTVDMDEYRARMARLEAGGFTPDARLAEPERRTTGPPRPIGQLVAGIAGRVQ